MSLQVIGAGFGRTGTMSLKTALEKLGYTKCHHMMELMGNKEQIDYWDRASKGEDMNWDEVFENYQASVDWPSVHYYKELAEHFPDARIILGIRDPEAWYHSVSETIYPVSSATPRWLRILLPFMQTQYEMIHRTIWDGKFQGRFEDQEFALKVFQDNIDEVQRVIPPERLLIHQPQDGWEPLCAFLGKAVPETPYPRVNEAKEIKRAIKILKVLGYLPWMVLLFVLLGLAYLAL